MKIVYTFDDTKEPHVMKYILRKGGFSINKQDPVIVDIIEASNIIEAKKVAKSHGKDFSVQAYVKRQVEFDIKLGGIPKDFFIKFADKL